MPTNDREYQREYMKQYRALKGKSSINKKPTLLSKDVKVVKSKEKPNPGKDFLIDFDKQFLLDLILKMRKFNFKKSEIKFMMELFV